MTYRNGHPRTLARYSGPPMQKLFYAIVTFLVNLTRSTMDLLTASAGEPPAKMISPSKTATSGALKTKRSRKAAAKERLAEQDRETQNTPHGVSSSSEAPTAKVSASQHQPCLSRRSIGANWQQAMAAAPANVLKTKRQPPQHPTPPKRLPVNKEGKRISLAIFCCIVHSLSFCLLAGVRITKHLAMDCEMVGIGFDAKKHMVARVSIVNQMGEVLMDRYVRPRERVVDYRTEVSGIRPADIANGEDFSRVQADVAALLDGRILVGHAVYNDLKVLTLQHPPKSIRDTSRYRPLINRITGGSTPSLKTLARCVLDVNIQTGEHSSVEDARAAMRIYNRYQEEWERSVRRRNN